MAKMAFLLFYFRFGTDGRSGEKCILGKHVTYTRRKQTSECFNGRDFERPRSVQVRIDWQQKFLFIAVNYSYMFYLFIYSTCSAEFAACGGIVRA